MKSETDAIAYLEGYRKGRANMVEWLIHHDTGDESCLVISQDDWSEFIRQEEKRNEDTI